MPNNAALDGRGTGLKPKRMAGKPRRLKRAWPQQLQIALESGRAIEQVGRLMTSTILRASLQAGLRGARANLVPGLALQALALSLVLAYYHVPSVQAALGRLAEFRMRTGLFYGIIATGFFGGLLPFLYLRAQPSTRSRYSLSQGIGLTLFWGYKGIEIDLLYRFLAWFVGEGTDVATIVSKTVIDQLIYCPLFAVPVTWAMYAWLEHQYEARPVWARFRASGWYTREVLPIMVSNAVVWLPAVAIVYLLPTPLQLPLQNIVLCFFTLLLAHLTRSAPPTTP
jgi:hypothetical protein